MTLTSRTPDAIRAAAEQLRRDRMMAEFRGYHHVVRLYDEQLESLRQHVVSAYKELAQVYCQFWGRLL